MNGTRGQLIAVARAGVDAPASWPRKRCRGTSQLSTPRHQASILLRYSSARRNANMSDRVDSTRPSRAFIESDRVEGTAIHDSAGRPLGTIKRLIIEKTSGRVAYVVISFGGTDEVPHAVPWGKLQYDVGLH